MKQSRGPEGLVSALVSSELTDEVWLRRVIVEELSALAQQLPAALRTRSARWLTLDASAGQGRATEPSLLAEVQLKAAEVRKDPELERVAAFWQRLCWMLAAPDREAIARLDPLRDCERIFHFVARDFRAELKVFAVLHEMRAAVSLPLASFFLNTAEFSERGVKRIVDTVLLVCNALEWGFESARGRYCIERIHAIHARYTIPDAAFKFVLAGIMFIPWEFNQRFGFRPFSEVERLGWFHAFVKLGRAMGIAELSDDFDTMYRWYREVSESSARFAPNKRRLVCDILAQVLERYPKDVRAVVASAFVAGMDDAYLTAAGLPRAPQAVERGIQQLFALAGRARAARARQGYWLQSLLKSSVYPNGYQLSELGVGVRSARLPETHNVLPSMSEAELQRRVAAGEVLIVIDGAVHDLTGFAELHPGGAALLRRHAGHDATEAFKAAPHSFATRWFRDNYRVALLEGANERDTARLDVASDSTQQLGERRSQQLPQPLNADSLEEWVCALLPLINGRSVETLTVAEGVAQLHGLLLARSETGLR